MSVADLTVVDRDLPRRLSVLPGTVDFDPSAKELLSGKISVFLDGKELAEVAGWNVDQGIVIRNRRYRDGRLVLSAHDHAPVLERLNGKVEVRWSSHDAEPSGGSAA